MKPVSIGTPNTPHATRVLMLGSGELGKEVVIELQRFGVEVIACDRFDLGDDQVRAPALEAEGWTVIPTAQAARLTMDREAIRRVAAEELRLPTARYQFADSFDELRAAASAVSYTHLRAHETPEH